MPLNLACWVRTDLNRFEMAVARGVTPTGFPARIHRPSLLLTIFKHRRNAWWALFDREELVKCLPDAPPPDQGCFRSRSLLTAARCVSKQGSPCARRGLASQPHNPPRDDPARVPAGTPLPASRRNLSILPHPIQITSLKLAKRGTAYCCVTWHATRPPTCVRPPRPHA